MKPDHQRFHFSATFRTEDAAVLHCLRALTQWANHGESHPMIGWGGTTEDDWKRRNCEATVRFTSEMQRQQWEDKATELLSGRWVLISKSNNDPAKPQTATSRFRR